MTGAKVRIGRLGGGPHESTKVGIAAIAERIVRRRRRQRSSEIFSDVPEGYRVAIPKVQIQRLRPWVGCRLSSLEVGPFAWSLRCFHLRIGVHESVILVSRGANIRFEFRSALVKGYYMPEVPDTTTGGCERETMRDRADGTDCVPV